MISALKRFLLLLIIVLFSCKKENKTSPQQTSSGGSAVNVSVNEYPNSIGNKWVYSYFRESKNFTGSPPATFTFTQTYTITVIADTILPNNSKGKIWLLTFSDTNWLPAKKVVYKDTSDGLFKLKEVQGYEPETISGTFSYPLGTTTTPWVNAGMSVQDSSKVISQDYMTGGFGVTIERGGLFSGFQTYKVNKKGCTYVSYSVIFPVEMSSLYITHTLLSTNF